MEHGELWYENKPTYWQWLISGLLLVSGFFLLFEHYWTKHYFDLELFGHEIYGLILIILGFLLSIKKNGVEGA